MSTCMDTYKHLNERDPLSVEIQIEDLARKVVAMNYGAHRFLSAMVRALRERWGSEDELAKVIEDALNRGLR